MPLIIQMRVISHMVIAIDIKTNWFLQRLNI